MKKMYLFLIIFASFIALLTCENMYNDIKDEIEPCKTTYAIGDTGPSGIGIVFYITDGGCHGLEAAPSDQSTGIIWAMIGYDGISVPGTLTTLGSGSANTDKIIAQNGALNTFAAGLARAYNGGAYTDWFLPSKDELNLMYINLKSHGVGGFAPNSYWSSSESGAASAWGQTFGGGAQLFLTKGSTYYVRALRAF